MMRISRWFLSLLILILLPACNLPTSKKATPTVDFIATTVAETCCAPKQDAAFDAERWPHCGAKRRHSARERNADEHSQPLPHATRGSEILLGTPQVGYTGQPPGIWARRRLRR